MFSQIRLYAMDITTSSNSISAVRMQRFLRKSYLKCSFAYFFLQNHRHHRRCHYRLATIERKDPPLLDPNTFEPVARSP